MANYHLNLSYGKVGKGSPHINYIMGEGKYSSKEKEIADKDSFMPPAITSNQFWKAADDNERINGITYKEIRISLPSELSLEENKNLLNEFIEKTLGKDYYYSVAIHDKESSYNKEINNIHAHIMFLTRKIDGHDRELNNFFKKSNSKNPEKGGAKKDVEWDSKEKLFSIRKEWEIIQNKFLEKNNIKDRVSSDSLSNQMYEALSKNEYEKAKFLNRNPINIDGKIYNKKNKSTFEKNEFQKFLDTRKIRDIKKEIYQLEVSLKKEKELDNKIDSLSEKNKSNFDINTIQ